MIINNEEQGVHFHDKAENHMRGFIPRMRYLFGFTSV